MSKELATTVKSDVGLQVEAKIRDFNFKIDEPEFNGGTDTGITPVELELSALGASLQREVEKVAKETNFKYQSLKIGIEGDIDLDGMHGAPNIPNGFQKIRINFDFKTIESKQKVQEVINKAITASKIYQLISKPAIVDNTLAEKEE